MATRLLQGAAGLAELAALPAADVVLVAVVGTAGLEPALAAIAAGKELALASKEILVLAGKFVMPRPSGAPGQGSCPSTASTTRSSSASRAIRARESGRSS